MVMHLRWCFALGIAVSLSASAQQQLKVKEDRGHVAPLRARVTFKNDKTRDVVVQGVGMHGDSGYLTHIIVVRTEDGVSKRVLWLDSITSLSGLDKIRTTRSEFTVKLKDGSEVPAMFTGEHQYGACEKGTLLEKPEDACALLHIANSDDGEETLDLRDLKAIRFLPATRKDKLGNAMFDTWKYSPFTGEKLSPVGN